jgi:hypothetical protein
MANASRKSHSDFARVFLRPEGLGLDLRATATFLGVNEFTARRWADGTMNPPGTVRGVVEALRAEFDLMPPELRAATARLVRERVPDGLGGFFAEALAREAHASSVARPAQRAGGDDLSAEIAALRERVARLEQAAGAAALQPQPTDAPALDPSKRRVVEL